MPEFEDRPDGGPSWGDRPDEGPSWDKDDEAGIIITGGSGFFVRGSGGVINQVVV